MTDHTAEARARLGWVEDWQSREGDSDATQIANVLAAQVHATLALVEEQRTANLVAALAIHVSAGAGAPEGLAARVDARLGLFPTPPTEEG